MRNRVITWYTFDAKIPMVAPPKTDGTFALIQNRANDLFLTERQRRHVLVSQFMNVCSTCADVDGFWSFSEIQTCKPKKT